MRAGVCLVSSSRLADCRATYGPRSERHFNSLLASNKKLKRLRGGVFPTSSLRGNRVGPKISWTDKTWPF